MLHDITLGDKTIVAVGLPEDAQNVRFRFNKFLTYRRLYSSHVELFDDKYKLIGIYPDMSEEQAKEIVEASEYYDPYQTPWGAIPCYKGYIDNMWKWQAKESFESLMQREKLYTVNPYDDGRGNDYSDFNYFEKKKGIFNNDGLLTVQEWIDKHKEAEARTFKNFAILLKLD